MQEPSALFHCQISFVWHNLFTMPERLENPNEDERTSSSHFYCQCPRPIWPLLGPRIYLQTTAASNENQSSSVTAGASPRELILPHLQPSMPETYAVCSEQKKIDQNGVRQIYQVGKSNSRARVFMVWQPELQESRKRRPGLLFDGYFEDLRSSESVLAQGGTSFSRSPVVFQ